MLKKTIASGSLLFLLAAPAWAQQNLNGLWDATVETNGLTIPFRFEITQQGKGAKAKVSGAFFNGDEKVLSTGGSLEGDTLKLDFDHYATKLEAKLANNELDGTYGRSSRGLNKFHAKRFQPVTGNEANVPNIAGLWTIPNKSPKGEEAWRFIVRQSGPEVSAAILRVDGDTGAISGRYRDGEFVLSHFSAARPSLLEITVQPDGSLAILQNGKQKLTALKASEAAAKGIPQPADPSRWTSVKDPGERFRFSGPDLDGKIVTEADARFQNKVVIVVISGSWCPNCHDEAPFLTELYKKYKSRGLEIVTLTFEEAEQLKNPTRLCAFNKRYGVNYTVLLMGEQSEREAKVPQAVNLNTWPATFYLGRDGKVRGTHAGFAGKASGEAHTALKKEVIHTVEQLLAEPAPSQQPTTSSAAFAKR